MRGGWAWVVGIAVGIVALTGVVALVGDDDRSGETVSAASWADRTCGAVAVWRGEMEAIVEDIRTPTLRRRGLRGATVGDAAGTHRLRPQGSRACRERDGDDGGRHRAGRDPRHRPRARRPQTWSRTGPTTAVDELEDALDTLDEEADTLEDAIDADRLRHAGDRLDARPAGSRTIAEVAQLDAEVASALRELVHLPAASRGGELDDDDDRLDPHRGTGPRRHRRSSPSACKSGGIGLGLWGGVGTLVLVFLFGLDPGEPPTSAMLIIIAVISAAAAMQAAGGVDYMVKIASTALRARPKALNFIAPYVSYVLTILTGTSNTFFSIIPVINEVAYANKIRPERALAGSTVASAFGITSSPVAAAMATILPLVEIYDYDLVDVLLITIPASIVGIFAMSLVMSRYGKELDDDPEYQRRLAAGEIQPPAPPAEIELLPFAKRSVAIFLAGVLAICVFGFVEDIRPTVAAEGGGVEPMSVTPLIQMIMLAAAALILVFAHVKTTDIPGTPIFKSGMVAMIALFGIAWMADTFIANNEDAIVMALGGLAENWPFTIAVAIFLVAALTTSQSAATRTMVPLGLALGIGAGYMIAMWTAVAGVLFLPANGTQIAAAEADTTGTTTLGKRVVDHSFQVPLQVAWIVTVLVGIGIVWLFFGDPTRHPHQRRRRRRVSVRGAAFLGIGAMVGAGIFALLGEAGAVAGSAVWLSFLLAGIVVRAARLHRRQARRALPVVGRADRLPDRRASATGAWSASRRGSATSRRS